MSWEPGEQKEDMKNRKELLEKLGKTEPYVKNVKMWGNTAARETGNK